MIQKLSHNLDDFSDRLPSTTSFSEKNLYMRTFSRWFPRYIMIHMWWNQCYCDLFRCLLPNFRESISREVLHQLDPGFVFDCRVQCLQHARAISFLCSLILQLDVPPFLNMHMAECAYQAAHIILRSSSFGIAELPFTDIQIIEHATLCLQFIQWMSTIYQNASSIVCFAWKPSPCVFDILYNTNPVSGFGFGRFNQENQPESFLQTNPLYGRAGYETG